MRMRVSGSVSARGSACTIHSLLDMATGDGAIGADVVWSRDSHLLENGPADLHDSAKCSVLTPQVPS